MPGVTSMTRRQKTIAVLAGCACLLLAIIVTVGRFVSGVRARGAVTQRVWGLGGELVHDYQLGPSPNYEEDPDGMNSSLFNHIPGTRFGAFDAIGKISIWDQPMSLEDFRMIGGFCEARVLQLDVSDLSCDDVYDVLRGCHRLEYALLRVNWSDDDKAKLKKLLAPKRVKYAL